ncbi:MULTISPECIES: glycosyltransferase family 2 protein [Exiguobacterium]|uniref:glycosyltransferase family 2 protein n=1 Tax=Exiguobacterium TaxID=33986 RepID=UPI002035E284|nr:MULTISPECIES: glycosyltransferase family 2 protein [Exiguobacterium]MCT4779606.1 glycosyltransferase family 2 protein [Exiguobacterium soli]
MLQAPVLGIVIPCYNESEVLPITINALQKHLSDWIRNGKISNESFVLFIDDGSRDDTWRQIERIHQHDARFQGIKLAHNVGHQHALHAGLMEGYEAADCLVSVDADLQDDLDIIETFVKQFQAGVDIVYGVRTDRTSDSWFKRTSAQWFYRLEKALGVETIYNHADFRLMSRRAVAALAAYPERNLFLRGLVPTLGFQTSEVPYTRAERLAGESKYPLRKMVALAWDGVTSFSVRPIKLLFFLSLFMVLVSGGFVGYTLYRFAEGETMSGWASLMLSIWFIGGLQLFGIGLIGEYVGKIFSEVKRRPSYTIEETLK